MNTMLYDRNEVCVKCKHNFKTKKYLSTRLKVDFTDTDYYRLYKDNENPYLYDIVICPSCGYAYGDKANRVITPNKLENLKYYFENIQNYKTMIYERDIDMGLRASKLALYISYVTREPNYIIGGLALKIAWINRGINDKEEELRFLNYAYINYQTAYYSEDLEKAGYERAMVLYLLADFARRLDRYEEARKWYGELFTTRGVKKILLDKARNVWEDYKDVTKSTVKIIDKVNTLDSNILSG